MTGPADGAAGRLRLASTSAEPFADRERVVPDLRGRTLRQALAMLAPLGVAVRLEGGGRVVAIC